MIVEADFYFRDYFSYSVRLLHCSTRRRGGIIFVDVKKISFSCSKIPSSNNLILEAKSSTVETAEVVFLTEVWRVSNPA